MRHCIVMCCDFFYPRLGGVEMHIWSLSQCLKKLGHKVIVVTHSVGKRKGIRYMTNGLKVYYLPMIPAVDSVAFPTFYSQFCLFRKILIREKATIVHGHQATSTMMHECILQASTMGYKTVYTDHSLFGFADIASVHLNKLMKFTLSDINHAIAVSHTCRENLVLRACLNPNKVAVIPNAVDAEKFTPDPSKRFPTDTLNIVIISRLVYRKGIDLVVKTIPIVAARYPNVYFIIGGDGNKRLLLEEMRDKHRLHDRVELLAAVPHTQVRDVLCRGHIFLNSSLTESFCIALLEAACCGLFVVSTRVGGVPEVLPPDMIKFSNEINEESLAEAIMEAIPLAKKVDPNEFHERVKQMYNWHQVAERTEVVYDKICRTGTLPLIERLRKYYGVGLFAGILACAVVSVMHIFLQILEWLSPEETIEKAVDLPYDLILKHQVASTENDTKIMDSVKQDDSIGKEIEYRNKIKQDDTIGKERDESKKKVDDRYFQN